MSARRHRQRVMTGRSNASSALRLSARQPSARAPPVPISPMASQRSSRSVMSQAGQQALTRSASTPGMPSARASARSGGGGGGRGGGSGGGVGGGSGSGRLGGGGGGGSARARFEGMSARSQTPAQQAKQRMFRSRRQKLNMTTGSTGDLSFTRRVAKAPPTGKSRTRSQMIEDRRRRRAEFGRKAAEDVYNKSLSAIFDMNERMKNPKLIGAANEPVSPRTLATTGTKGFSNKARVRAPFLPPDAPPGMANWTAKPHFPTQSALLAQRKFEMRPPMSYDFDGDGYVDDIEYFIGCRLDVNKDGRIDTAERKEGAKLLRELQENYIFGLEAAGPVIYSDISHRVSDVPQIDDDAKKRLVPPWETTPRRSLHLSARKVDPTRTSMGRANRRFKPGDDDHALGKGANLLEEQAGAVGTGQQQKGQLSRLAAFM